MISTGKNKVTKLKLHRDNKESPPEKRGRKGSKWPFFLLTIFLGYFIFSLGSQFSRLHTMHENMNSLQNQVKELNSRNATLRDQIKQIKSDSYIEQVAREQLGLVKPGETLVVPAQSQQVQQGNNQAGAVKPQGNSQSNQKVDVKYKNIYD